VSEQSRWLVADTRVCDFVCQHEACAAYQAAQGRCGVCLDALELDEHFAYRSGGQGASHIACRLNQMGREPVLPRLVLESGEFRISVPRSAEEAQTLHWFRQAAERFLAAVSSALQAYEGADVVTLRGEERP
jgi:hypothetical protein